MFNSTYCHFSSKFHQDSALSQDSREPKPGVEIPKPGPPPNGGLQAWIQVLGAHFLFFNSWGIVNTFSAFQAYFESDLLKNKKASQIAWIGTFKAFSLISISLIAGPILDRGYFRTLIIAGTFLRVFGLMMASVSTQYYSLFLSLGFCNGLGGGMLFLPSVAIVSTYFTTKRALAIGIVASGGSISSVIYPIMFRKLQPEVGFPWAIRIIGFVAFATLLLSIAIMRTRLPPMERARALFDWTAFTHWPYTIFSIGLFLAYIGLYIPIFYIVIIAQRKANSSTGLSFYLLAILNGASVFGRIIPRLLADKFGAMEVMLTCTLLSALFAYILIAIHSFPGLVIFACFYGFVFGAVVSMPPTVVATLVPNFQVMGTWMGTIINIEEADFKDAFILAGTVILAGGLLFIVARIMSVVEQRKIRKESGSKPADR